MKNFMIVGKDHDEFLKEIVGEIRSLLNSTLSKEALAYPEVEEYLTEREVCSKLRISKPTLNKWVKEGKFVKYQIGKNTVRYKLSELVQFFNNLKSE